MVDAFVYCAALLCSDCGEAARKDITGAGHAPADPENESSYDSDQFPKGPYPDGGGEADAPQHCDHCGTFLENPLTPMTGTRGFASRPRPMNTRTITGTLRLGRRSHNAPKRTATRPLPSASVTTSQKGNN
jgi:hypothetical protein